MRTINKPVYYCEYCKKHGLSKFHMEQHEMHCTANPARVCRLCLCSSDASLKLCNEITRETSLEDIRGATDGCPNCILMVIKNIRKGMTDDEAYDNWFNDFDYKKELAGYWADKNADAYRDEVMDCYY